MSRDRLFSGLPLVGGPILTAVDFSAMNLVVKWDVSGPLSARAQFNNKPKEFAYLATDPLPFRLYVKQAQTGQDSDWSLGQTIAPNTPNLVEQLLDLRDLILGEAVPLFDRDYQALPKDRQVNILTMTAPRTIFLPDVTTYNDSFEFVVADVNGVVADNRVMRVRPLANSTQRIVNADQSIIELYEPYQKIKVRKVANDAWMLM
jgi:hypothetical protein